MSTPNQSSNNALNSNPFMDPPSLSPVMMLLPKGNIEEIKERFLQDEIE